MRSGGFSFVMLLSCLWDVFYREGAVGIRCDLRHAPFLDDNDDSPVFADVADSLSIDVSDLFDSAHLHLRVNLRIGQFAALDDPILSL